MIRTSVFDSYILKIEVKDINDFISDVDLAMKCQKPPLLLQKTNKIIENVN